MKWIGLAICVLGILGFIGMRDSRNEPYREEYIDEGYVEYAENERLETRRAKEREDVYVEEKRREEARGDAQGFGNTAKGLRGI